MDIQIFVQKNDRREASVSFILAQHSYENFYPISRIIGYVNHFVEMLRIIVRWVIGSFL